MATKTRVTTADEFARLEEALAEVDWLARIGTRGTAAVGQDAGPPPVLEQRTSGRLILGPGAVAQLLAALTAVAQQAQIATQVATLVPANVDPASKTSTLIRQSETTAVAPRGGVFSPKGNQEGRPAALAAPRDVVLYAITLDAILVAALKRATTSSNAHE